MNFEEYKKKFLVDHNFLEALEGDIVDQISKMSDEERQEYIKKHNLVYESYSSNLIKLYRINAPDSKEDFLHLLLMESQNQLKKMNIKLTIMTIIIVIQFILLFINL